LPGNTRPEMIYYVLRGTLNSTHSLTSAVLVFYLSRCYSTACDRL